MLFEPECDKKTNEKFCSSSCERNFKNCGDRSPMRLCPGIQFESLGTRKDCVACKFDVNVYINDIGLAFSVQGARYDPESLSYTCSCSALILFQCQLKFTEQELVQWIAQVHSWSQCFCPVQFHVIFFWFLPFVDLDVKPQVTVCDATRPIEKNANRSSHLWKVAASSL